MLATAACVKLLSPMDNVRCVHIDCVCTYVNIFILVLVHQARALKSLRPPVRQ